MFSLLPSALSAGIAATLLTVPCTASAATVSVTVGEDTRSFSAAEVAAHAGVAASDWQRDDAAERIPDATALRELISLAGGDPDAVRNVSLSIDGSSALRITGRLLAEGPPYGSGPPVPVLLWAEADGALHVGRPVGPSQLTDRLDVGAGSTLSVAVEGGERLQLRVRASSTSVKAEQTVTLTALLGDSPPDARVAWQFDDGRSARGLQVQHAFRRPGRYAVTATAVAEEARGEAAVEIVVGRAPPPAATPRTSPSETARSTPAATPAASGPAARPQTPAAPASSAGRRRAVAPPRAATPQRRSSPAAAERPQVAGELIAAQRSARSTPAARSSGTRAERRPQDKRSLARLPWQGVAAVLLLVGGGLLEWRLGRRGVRP